MRVGVEEAVPEDHLHPGVGDPVRQLAARVHRRQLELQIGELHALEVLERQHPHAGVVPVDPGHDDGVRVREVAPERVGVPRLELVVELLPDEARELVDEVVDVDEVERADALPDQAGGLVEEGKVVLDLTRRVRPLHLDDHLVAVREHRPVHLADRRGCDRRLSELDERLLERQAEFAFDDLPHLRERERAHVVLQPAQLGDDVRRDDVGPGREQLAELDERRPELVEHLAQVPPALRAGGRLGARLDPRRPRKNVGELVALEEVAEAVPDGHLRDLREPAHLARARSSRHPGSVPRRGKDSASSCARSESAGADSDRAKTPKGSLRSRTGKIGAWTRAFCFCSSAASWRAALSSPSVPHERGCPCSRPSWRSGCCSAPTAPAGSSSTTRSSPGRSAWSGSR